MPSVDFDAARRERSKGGDPIKFKLGGEWFTPRQGLPFQTIADHLNDTKQYSQLETFNIACDFIRDECLLAKDHARFNKALRSKTNPVGDAEVLGVMSYLVRCYVARPTLPPAVLSNGRHRSGGTSNSTPSNGSARKASGRSRAASRSTGSRNA